LLAGRASQICCGKLMRAVGVPEPGRNELDVVAEKVLVCCFYVAMVSSSEQVKREVRDSQPNLPRWPITEIGQRTSWKI